MTAHPIITLLTDFGLCDSYAASMKGIILGIAPDAQIVDITHHVSRHDVQAAAFILASAAPHFPKGTIHVTVVDPGVGGARRPIAVETQNAFFVAPDNGILTLALEKDPPVVAVALTCSRFWLPEVSDTFHGRDVFAPVAAHIANGIRLDDLGAGINDMVRLDIKTPARREDGGLEGRVLHVDAFGNCITDIPESLVSERKDAFFEVAGRRIKGIAGAYEQGKAGEPIALIGSSGFVEIAVNRGNASKELGISAGAPVVFKSNGRRFRRATPNLP